VTKVKSSREVLIALVCVLSVVAVLAMVMALRGPAGQQFVASGRCPDPTTVFTTAHICRTPVGFAFGWPTRR